MRAKATPIAIIGDGVAALITFAVLCHAGIPATDITIYGESPHPLATLQRYASAVGQKMMRSESNGHLAAVDFPGLALREAWQRRSLWPLLASLFDLYAPSLDLLLCQGARLERELGFQERKITTKVTHLERSERSEQPHAAFALVANGSLVGMAQHIILALGHGGLAWPEAALRWQTDSRVTHAYQAVQVQGGEHIVVVGGGMAAVQTWIRALKKGASVTALYRQPLCRQRLNAPRCAFRTAEIESYRRLEPAQRHAYLKKLGAGTFPWRWHWEWALWRARSQGCFTTVQGELTKIEELNNESAAALVLHVKRADGSPLGTRLRADKLICATGFQSDAQAHPLIRQLVNHVNVPTTNGVLQLNDDFTLPPLSQPENLCTVVGALARWALPVADTFAGIKYAARRIALLMRT